jgi:hypothetical protein
VVCVSDKEKAIRRARRSTIASGKTRFVEVKNGGSIFSLPTPTSKQANDEHRSKGRITNQGIINEGRRGPVSCDEPGAITVLADGRIKPGLLVRLQHRHRHSTTEP